VKEEMARRAWMGVQGINTRFVKEYIEKPLFAPKIEIFLEAYYQVDRVFDDLYRLKRTAESSLFRSFDQP
jgi:hypothetical protein